MTIKLYFPLSFLNIQSNMVKSHLLRYLYSNYIWCLLY